MKSITLMISGQNIASDKQIVELFSRNHQQDKSCQSNQSSFPSSSDFFVQNNSKWCEICFKNCCQILTLLVASSTETSN